MTRFVARFSLVFFVALVIGSLATVAPVHGPEAAERLSAPQSSKGRINRIVSGEDEALGIVPDGVSMSIPSGFLEDGTRFVMQLGGGLAFMESSGVLANISGSCCDETISDPLSTGLDYLYQLGDLLDILPDDIGTFIPQKVSYVGLSGFDVLFTQQIDSWPVFHSRVELRLVEDGVKRLSGRYLTSDHIAKIHADVASRTAPNSRCFDGGLERPVIGVFDGSLFGLEQWNGTDPRIACMVLSKNIRGEYERRYLDYCTGEELLVIRASLGADIDTYYLTSYPQSAVKLDSTDACGSGAYPNCSWWPGTSAQLRAEVEALSEHYSSYLGRDSWASDDVMNCSELDNGDPLLEKCCLSGSPHRFAHISDLVVNPPNSFFNPSTCMASFHSSFICPDFVGHEYGHGLDYGEKQVLEDWLMSPQPVPSPRHAGAMAEGFADIVGESYQQIEARDVSTPWVLGDGCVSQGRNMAAPEGDRPRHASQFEYNPPPGQDVSHYNASVVDHAFYILARDPAEGPISHFGVSVQGIGIQTAYDIFVDAFTTEMQDSVVPRSLSDMREALLSSALKYGSSSNEYIQTAAMVNSMGYWTNEYEIPIDTIDSRPEMGRYGIFTNQELQYKAIVYRDSTSIKMYYYYRYLDSYWNGYRWVFRWVSGWNGPITIATTSQPGFRVISDIRFVGSTPYDFTMYVLFIDQYKYLKMMEFRGDGSTPINYITLNGVNVQIKDGKPISSAKFNGTHRLFYTPNSSNYVYWATLDLASHTLSGYASTGITNSGKIEAATDDSKLMLFVLPSGASSVSQYNYTSGSWLGVTSSNSKLAAVAGVSDIDVTSYLSGVHVVLRDPINRVRYMRCSAGCDQLSEWSNPVPVSTDYEPVSVSLFALGTEFGFSGGVTLITKHSDWDHMTYRQKFSQ